MIFFKICIQCTDTSRILEKFVILRLYINYSVMNVYIFFEIFLKRIASPFNLQTCIGNPLGQQQLYKIQGGGGLSGI